MTDLFGNYRSQETKALQDINSSKYPDTNKDFEKNIQRLNEFVDYISSYLQTMQKGVDQANEDPITKLKQTVLDLGTIFSGGELLYGINLGDLQYFLPAIGAMFGFDSSQPFPLNLLYAAEHFFLGYILPLNAWASAVEDVIDGWATALGLSPEFITSVNNLLDAMQSVTNDFLDFFNTIVSLFDIFGITDSTSTGPLADLWHAVTQLLGGFNIQSLGQLIDPVLNSLAPWIEDLAQFTDWLDQIVKSWSGGTANLAAILKAPLLFTDYMNFLDANWTSFSGWETIINSVFSKSQVFGKVVASQPIPIGNIINELYNYQTNGDFATPDVVSPNGDWVHDSTVGRTWPGSWKATARGHLLRSSGEWVNCLSTDILNPIVYVFWSGLTYTGANPVRLYMDFDNAPSVLVAELSSPPANALTWVELTGTVPVPAGATLARLQFVVDGGATAGSIWFDDSDFFKELSLLPQDWVDGLTSAWNSFLALFNLPDQAALNAQAANTNAFWTTFWNDIFNPLGLATPQTTTNTLNTWLQQIGQIFNGQAVTPINTYAQQVKDWWSSITNQTQHLTSGGALPATAISGTLPNAQVSSALSGSSLGADLTTFLNNVANFFGGTTGNQTQASTATAVQSAANTLASTTGAVTALQATAQQAAQGGGTNYSTSFSAADATLTPFTAMPGGIGSSGLNGGTSYAADLIIAPWSGSWNALTWSPAGTSGYEMLLLNTIAQTDYTKTSCNFGSSPGTGEYYFLFGRCNLTGTIGACAVIGSNTVEIFVFNGSTWTLLPGSLISTVFSAGNVYTLVCGLPGSSSNTYQLLIGGSPITSGVDTGNIATVGANNRSGGLGVVHNGLSGVVPSIHSFTFVDNAQPSVFGAGMRAINNSSSVVNIGGVAQTSQLFSGSFFNIKDNVSADMVYFTGSNTCRVGVTGRYAVTICVPIASTVANQTVKLVLFHNNTVEQIGASFYVPFGATYWAVRETFFVECAAGDILTPGTWATTTGAWFVGDATGLNCYYEVTLCNTGPNG